MLGDREAAEDAVQEAATKAWRSIGNLRERTSPQPWFFAIVANQCRDARRRSRMPQTSLNDVPELSVEDHADTIVRDLDLERALSLLPREQRGLLFLRYHLDRRRGWCAHPCGRLGGSASPPRSPWWS